MVDITKTSLVILASIGVSYILVYLKELFIPFVIAVFITYLITPIQEFLMNPLFVIQKVFRRKKRTNFSALPQSEGETTSPRSREEITLELPECVIMPRWLAATLSLLIFGGFLFGIGVVVAGSINQLKDNFGRYEDEAARIYDVSKEWVDHFQHVLGSNTDDMQSSFVDVFSGIVGWLLEVIVDLFAQAIMVFIFVCYLLISRIRPTRGLWIRIDRHITHYIRVKTVISFLVGLAVGLVLYLLKVDLAFVFGVMTFCFNFIPNVGAFASTLCPLPIILLDPLLHTSSKILAIVLPFTIHFLCGNFVEPLVFGKELEIHALTVLFGLSFWGILWGITGMLLSVPITAVIKIALEHQTNPTCQKIAAIMEGKLPRVPR
eukprot:TRINITY_DN780014_c0_g1_i1.p1 TRINITY_DN780014_c0_g1~~TRINITY_DN780014_c0_g1_i1.p1  ORF type:complete len:377 (-),score=64.66 TRINITY_DN780014_c0_g1_i1:219-1349(-)